MVIFNVIKFYSRQETSHVLKRSSFSPKQVSHHCNGNGKREAGEGKGEREEHISHPIGYSTGPVNSVESAEFTPT